MTIRQASKSDYVGLNALFKEFFVAHNRFSQNDKEVIEYLKSQAENNQLIVHETNNKLDGAMFIVKTDQNDTGTHTKWKFRHFAYKNHTVGKELLVYAEEFVKKSSDTSKIELTIAETEEDIDFLKKNDYEEEGALKHHYRWDETCYVLSKWFSND